MMAHRGLWRPRWCCQWCSLALKLKDIPAKLYPRILYLYFHYLSPFQATPWNKVENYLACILINLPILDKFFPFDIYTKLISENVTRIVITNFGLWFRVWGAKLHTILDHCLGRLGTAKQIFCLYGCHGISRSHFQPLSKNLRGNM